MAEREGFESPAFIFISEAYKGAVSRSFLLGNPAGRHRGATDHGWGGVEPGTRTPYLASRAEAG